jgi:hypothetical protein
MDAKIKQLNKAKVQMLREGIQQQLDKLGDLYGMTIKLGNIRYDSISFRTKVEAHVDEPVSGVSFEQEAFNSACWRYGLQPEDYLKEVKLNGQKYYGTKAKLYGFNPKAKRYPVLVRTDSGHLVKASTGILNELKK